MAPLTFVVSIHKCNCMSLSINPSSSTNLPKYIITHQATELTLVDNSLAQCCICITTDFVTELHLAKAGPDAALQLFYTPAHWLSYIESH